ncbi:hypothetical protein ACHAPU_007430 [Fusarium lateritium]
MKPVSKRHVSQLLELGSILILDETLWSVSYINHLICRNPANVSTKIGHKTLPTELWLQILSWAQLRLRSHQFTLIYAVGTGLVQDGAGREELALICNEVKEWRACGELRNGAIIDVYQKYLWNPSYVPTTQDRGEILAHYRRYGEHVIKIEDIAECPFKVTKTAEDDAISIPISHLGFETRFLFRSIKVPDMISFLEG